MKDHHAKLVIYGLDSFKKNDTKRLVSWLEQLTKTLKKELVEDPKIYAKTATWKLMK